MNPTPSRCGAARTSLLLRGDTATTRRPPPHSHADSAVISSSSRATAMRTNTPGGTLAQNICTERRIAPRTSWRSLLLLQEGGRGAERRDEDHGDYEMDFLEFSRYPSYCNGPPQHYHSDENELGDDRDRDDHPRWSKKNGRNISPLPSPKKRWGTWDSERPAPPPPRVSPPSTSSQEKDYDGTFLNSLLERKAKLRGVSQGKSSAGGRKTQTHPQRAAPKRAAESPVDTAAARRAPGLRPIHCRRTPTPSETEQTGLLLGRPPHRHALLAAPGPLAARPQRRAQRQVTQSEHPAQRDSLIV
ncbi:hypothetical protein INR49_004212 [Caranx melampygus]|nr:hypothetical protein INR49_004212 [Caranx melampygus]